jgi:DmsE family decaheme c-type cytochrome
MKERRDDGTRLQKLQDAAIARRLSAQARFLLLLGVALVCSTAGLAQQVEGDSAGRAEAAACAPCHQAVVKEFAGNPHSQPAQVHGTQGGSCESCHGAGKAHAQDGEVALIFNPVTATAKEVDERCQTCHGGNHAGSERSTHSKANVSCIGCHRIHSAGVSAHQLKKAQPDLCYQCHKDVKPQFSMPSRHKVAEGLIQCTDCHDAHVPRQENERRATSWQFDECTKCHAATAGPFLHEHPVVKVEGCITCHFPHGGENPKLLIRANMNSICLQCHAPSANSSNGRPDVPEHIQSAQSQPCIRCHADIHGSNSSAAFLRPARTGNVR